MSTPTQESLKDKAKVIRKFMKEKCNVDVSHGHCLELISKLFGFNDWNTASAKSKVNQKKLPIEVRTVGEMRRALESFKDSDIIDGMYEFKIKDFIEGIEADGELEDAITQEFSFVLESLDDSGAEPRIASFKLMLEDETIGHEIPTEFPPDCGFYN